MPSILWRGSPKLRSMSIQNIRAAPSRLQTFKFNISPTLKMTTSASTRSINHNEQLVKITKFYMNSWRLDGRASFGINIMCLPSPHSLPSLLWYQPSPRSLPYFIFFWDDPLPPFPSSPFRQKRFHGTGGWRRGELTVDG